MSEEKKLDFNAHLRAYLLRKLEEPLLFTCFDRTFAFIQFDLNNPF
jgi:hypothetical protein